MLIMVDLNAKLSFPSSVAWLYFIYIWLHISHIIDASFNLHDGGIYIQVKILGSQIVYCIFLDMIRPFYF